MDPAFEQSPEYKEARRRVRRLRAFYSHVGVYLAVNGGLLVINLLTTPGRLWVLGSLAGWGIAVVIHALGVFLRGNVFGAEWEQRKLRELLENQRPSRP